MWIWQAPYIMYPYASIIFKINNLRRNLNGHFKFEFSQLFYYKIQISGPITIILAYKFF